MTDFRSRNVMTGRFRTHYTECGGNGPALVLCHGGGPGSSGEAGFGQLMPTLAAKFQVYALDSVGVGNGGATKLLDDEGHRANARQDLVTCCTTSKPSR